MRPITDRQKITRAKLAYIIDATAAPVCIIAPISSWAAAVSSSLPEDAHINGFSLFLQTIPFNLYALLTLAFLIWVSASDIDFFAMSKYNQEVKKSGKVDSTGEEATVIVGSGQVKDLIVPIVFLIATCILAMYYPSLAFLASTVSFLHSIMILIFSWVCAVSLDSKITISALGFLEPNCSVYSTRICSGKYLCSFTNRFSTV